MRRPIFLLLAILALLALVSCNQDTISEESYKHMYGHLSDCWAQSLSHANAEIAFYGDSRVCGADWYSAYPTEKVVNLGVGGDKIADLIRRISVLDNLEDLDTIFVAIGGNDCISSKYDRKVFYEEYDRLLELLEQRGLTIYVNTIAGVCRKKAEYSQKTIDRINANMNQANSIIKDLAAKYGIAVIDIAKEMDTSSGVLKAEYASEDGVHLSAEGNALWYEVLRPYVEK